MKKPTLTVAMPNYNHARFLHEAIQAILDQSYRPTEFIIIDDGSTDNSVEIIEEFAKKEPIIKFIRHERNMGIDYTSPKLLELATGDYYYGSAADDKILPGFFEKSMKLLEMHPEAGLCSTLMRFIDEDGNDKGLRRGAVISAKECYISSQRAQTILTQYGNWMYGNTTIYRRQALLEVGGFMSELKSSSDGVILPVISIRYGACFVPEVLACWRLMESGYAMTCCRDPEIQLDVIKKATNLMEVTYRDLLPARYVKLWEKKELLRLNLNICQAGHERMFSTLTELRPPKTFLDKLFLIGLQTLLRIEVYCVKAYLFFLYRYLPLDILRRYVVSFFYKTLLSLKGNRLSIII